jgi:hypothetical protein
VTVSGSDPSVRRAREGVGAAVGDCPGKPFETVLASPSPEALSDLEVDDLLDVVAVETPARGVVAQTIDGTYVGAVVRDILRLRQCLQEGHTYEAEVRAVDGGSITVLIRPV